ncbi:DNA-binding NarL/FixJ family response regulator [Azospirillum lipoferum]|uniref:Response regulator n=1 Tax=Azospirillum lipoferum TaxID=193 RepID=A0A5A9GI15_AZOLI|nr:MULTISPECIES: response regulator transcription factor [Azospirillum]KAA0592909.1 response regulator [Azospirillum lipoferum]MCP1614043.1 DNA-binding NarL/FixJ family response regulator [Azospirillum lipoferum]MDW5537567.1 response regulator transcription factor [Azospirillum sp. NL1]
MGKTAIIVDDSKLSRMHVRAMVLRNKPDWAVVEAANGDELFRILQDTPVDVAIIDYNMPGDNGVETAAKLRQSHPDVHIAIITANAQDAVVSGIRAVGAAFMPKPLEEEQVTRFLNSTALPPRRSTQAAPE